MASNYSLPEWVAQGQDDQTDWLQIVRNLEQLLARTTTELQQERSQRLHLTADLHRMTQTLETQLQTQTASLTQALHHAEARLGILNRELATLHQIAQATLKPQSLHLSFQEVVQTISTASGFPIVAIELYDKARQMMVFAETIGIDLPPGQPLEVPTDCTLSGTVAQTGEAIVKVYQPGEAKTCDSNDTLKRLGIKTFVCIPMIVEQDIIGVLSLAHPDGITCDEACLQWLFSLANTIAALVHRKQAEAALQQSEDRYRQAVENSPNPIFAIDHQGNIQTWNPACKQFYQYDRAIVGQSYACLFATAAAFARVEEQVQQVFQGQALSGVKIVFRCQNGTEKIMLSRLYPILTTTGQVQSCVFANTDITDRELAEAALQASEAKYRRLVQTSQDLIWSIDQDGYFTFVNPAAQTILGYQPAEMLDRPFSHFQSPEQVRRDTRIWRQALAGKAISHYETSLIAQTGKRRYLVLSATVLWDDAGNLLGATGTATDITQRKQAEQQQAQLTAILEATSDIVGIADANGYSLYLNQAGRQLLGLTADQDLATVRCREFIAPDAQHILDTALQTIVRDGIWSGESRLYNPQSGAEFPVSQVMMAHRSDTGELETISTIARDITVLKQAEQQLQQSELQYRRIFESVTDGLHIFDLETGALVEANPAAHQMHGYTYDEFLNLNPGEFVHPDSYHLFGEFIATIKAGQPFYCEAANVHRDGSRIDIEVRGTGLIYNNQPHILSIVRDITDRKRAAAALHQSEAYLRTVIENVPLVLWAIDQQGKFTLMEGKGMEQMSPEARTLVGRSAFEVCQAYPDLVSALHQTLATGAPYHVVVETPAKITEAWGTALQTEPGEITGIIGVSLDVTDRHRAAIALQESESRYRLLFEANPNPILVFDQEDLHFLAVNEAAVQHYGYSHVEFLTLTLQDLCPAEELAPAVQAMQTGYTQAGIWRHCKQDGSLIEVEITLNPLTWLGKPAKMVLVNDVTDRRRLETTIRNIALGVASATGKAFFESLVQHLAQVLEADVACVGELIEPERQRVQTVAAFANGQIVENYDYALPGTPCQNTLDHSIYIHSQDLQQHFPEDPILVEWGMESYSGATLFDSRGQSIGILAVLSSRPSRNTQFIREILQIFSVRAASELERMRAEAALKRLNEELEARVIHRTAELANTVTQLQQEIEQRQRSEQALRDSENLYRTLIENFPDGVVLLFDHDLRYTIADGAGLAAMGMSRLDYEGKTIWEVLPPPVCDCLLPVYQQTLVGIDTSQEFLFDNRLYHVRSVPVRNQQGEIFAGMVLAHDVTNRHQAERALRQSEENFRQLAETIHEVFFLRSGDAEQIIYVSPAYEKVWGRTCQSLYENPRSWLDAVHPDDQAQVVAAVSGQIQQPDRYSMEYRIIRPDGCWRWIRCQTALVFNLAGVPYRIAGIAEDITPRKLAEAALQTSESLLRQIADTVPGAVFQLKLDAERQWSYQFVSRGIVDLMGYSSEQLQADFSLQWQQILPEDRDRLLACKLESATHLTPCLIDFRIQHANGNLCWIQGQALPGEPNPDGSLVWTGILMDITDRKAAEAQLKNSLEEKELLLKEVHHRVKNNLQVVCSIFSLQSQYIEDPKTLEILIESQNRINTMALIHEKLYQSSSLARIDFVDYIRNLTSSLFASYATQANRITLKLNVSQVSLNLDTAIRCGLIINELISNALKYAFPAGQAGEIQLDFAPTSDGKLKLVVQDSGIGLPPDLDLEQTNSLGLRLVRILIRKLKGTLDIDQQAGARFQIIFAQPE